MLETLQNRNINQTLPEEVEEMEDVKQPLMRLGEEVMQRMGKEVTVTTTTMRRKRRRIWSRNGLSCHHKAQEQNYYTIN